MYLRAVAAGLPFLYLSYAGNGHLIGLEDMRTPLRIAVGANLVNIALESALVFGAQAGLPGSARGTGWPFGRSRLASCRWPRPRSWRG